MFDEAQPATEQPVTSTQTRVERTPASAPQAPEENAGPSLIIPVEAIHDDDGETLPAPQSPALPTLPPPPLATGNRDSGLPTPERVVTTREPLDITVEPIPSGRGDS